MDAEEAIKFGIVDSVLSSNTENFAKKQAVQ